MDKKLLAIAMAGVLAAPSMGGAAVLERPKGGLGDWFKANGKGGTRPKNMSARDASRLQLRSYSEVPCEAPNGYFWLRDLAGKHNYRLYKKAPGERHVEYDELNDRSIIRSGWGYVKPTYAPGDVRHG